MPTLADLLTCPHHGSGPGDWVDASEVERLPATGGAYLLAIRLDRALRLPIARLGEPEIPEGAYIYGGSAYGPGGIRARVARHFLRTKAIHWHIDHLTVAARSITALAVPGGNECELVSRLIGNDTVRTAVNGFGSSDCRRCPSHLLICI